MRNIFKLDTSHWYVVRASFLLGGLLTLTAVLLALLVSKWWVLLAGFVALMFILFALTGYCPGAILMHKAGVPRD
jgi:hypothetical protein